MKHDYAVKITEEDGEVHLATATMCGLIELIWSPEESEFAGFSQAIHSFMANNPVMEIHGNSRKYEISYNPLKSH